MNTLQVLLEPWVQQVVPTHMLREITSDSRNAMAGDLFVAVPGHQVDGRFYIAHAIEQGVVAVLSEIDSDLKVINGDVSYFDGVPIIYINKLNLNLSAIAGRFYHQPSRMLNLIGVTGTNGKTTVTHLLANWIKLLDEKSAVLGTLGNGELGCINPSKNTTCSAIEIQQLLSTLYCKGVRFVAMEVSSHGLAQDRVNALYFRAAVFTNLSQEHLDYHGDMIQYELTKWKLFSKLQVDKYIINADDVVGYRWLSNLTHGVAVTLFGRLPNNWQGLWLCAITIDYHCTGTYIFFDSSWGKGLICSKLIGEFNVSNILLALATLLTLGYPLPLLLSTASQLQGVSGRVEIFRAVNWPTVVVDYAHTPDSLKKVLTAIRSYCYGKLWCVFGCGGDRDKRKRPLMAAIAEKYADRVIITNDNPRNESPHNIIDEIKNGILYPAQIQIIPDRATAVTDAIMQSAPLDWVLVAGKGHENYQIVGNQYYHYSDKIIIQQLLEK